MPSHTSDEIWTLTEFKLTYNSSMNSDLIPPLLVLLIFALVIGETMIFKKSKEQAQFDKLVEKEKTLKDYRLLAELFRSDQFTSKQMTEEFKANPEFKDWYFKNYIALEKWRSI